MSDRLLTLAILGTLHPVVETDPARLEAMAAALDHFGRHARAAHIRSLVRA